MEPTLSTNTQSLIVYMDDATSQPRKRNKQDRYRLLVDKATGDVKAQTGKEISWWVRLLAKVGIGPAYIGNVNAALKAKREEILKDLSLLDDDQKALIKKFTDNLHQYNRDHIFLKKIKDIVSFTLDSQATPTTHTTQSAPKAHALDDASLETLSKFIQERDFAQAWKLLETMEDLSEVHSYGHPLIETAIFYGKEKASECIDFLKNCLERKAALSANPSASTLENLLDFDLSKSPDQTQDALDIAKKLFHHHQSPEALDKVIIAPPFGLDKSSQNELIKAFYSPSIEISDAGLRVAASSEKVSLLEKILNDRPDEIARTSEEILACLILWDDASVETICKNKNFTDYAIRQGKKDFLKAHFSKISFTLDQLKILLNHFTEEADKDLAERILTHAFPTLSPTEQKELKKSFPSSPFLAGIDLDTQR